MLRRQVLAAVPAAAALAAFGSPARAAGKGTVRIVYVEWADAIVATNILSAALKQAGYDTRLTPVSGAAMWEAVASGDADAMVAAWLPATHAAYYAKLKNKVDVLGPNIEGARIGWVVPDYVTVDSIADIKANASMFGGKIIGIDPGAGLMRASEKAMTEYSLAPMQLVDGSDATMVAALKDAVSRKQPVVVTGWTPHFMWAAFKLKYLADPKGVFGGDETVNNVARKGLAKDMPEVHAILSRFKLSLPEEQRLMMQNQASGVDPAKTAAEWVSQHPDVVKSWMA
jgi:glycine betaine/proline transport system substrate-binding protein